MKKVYTLAGLMLATVLIAATSFLTTISVRQAGPFYFAATSYDSTNINGVGGAIKTYWVAASDTERIGNVVYISAKNTVSHSATLANYNAIAGVVVGGARTSMQASYAVADTQTIAATAGQKVLVMERGRFWVMVDTGAGIAPGITVIPSTKSGMGGRVLARTTAIDTFNRVFAKMIDTRLVGKAGLAEIRVR